MSSHSYADRLAPHQVATVIAVCGDDIRLIVTELRDIARIHRMAGDLGAAEHVDASASRLALAYNLDTVKPVV